MHRYFLFLTTSIKNQHSLLINNHYIYIYIYNNSQICDEFHLCLHIATLVSLIVIQW